jgi:predicted DNA-binding transcriptional regulator YafY
VKTRVRDEFGFDQVIVNPNETLSVTTHFSSTERAIQKILSYGSQVTVTEPLELIKELQRHIQNMAELYKL